LDRSESVVDMLAVSRWKTNLNNTFKFLFPNDI